MTNLQFNIASKKAVEHSPPKEAVAQMRKRSTEDKDRKNPLYPQKKEEDRKSAEKKKNKRDDDDNNGGGGMMEPII